jgi:cell division protein FtsB
VQEIRSKRRRNPEVWHKANRLVIILIVLAIIGGALLAFIPEIARHKSLTNQFEQEKESLAREKLVNRQRAREVHLLQNDPEYVEIIARDRLGVMKEGETILRLDSNPKAASPVANPPKTTKP